MVHHEQVYGYDLLVRESGFFVIAEPFTSILYSFFEQGKRTLFFIKRP